MAGITQEHDVLMVGGGPAGSSCAIRLAREGLRVALVEQKRFPRPKLCGEFISPECLTHFAELGVDEQIHLSNAVSIDRTVFYARNGRSVEVPSQWFGANAVGLSRARMDQILLDKAAANGVEVLQETTAKGLLRDPDGAVAGVAVIDKDRREHKMDARLVIDATGRSRVLSRLAGGQIKTRRAPYVAFKAHLDQARVPSGDCEIYSYPGGYGGCCAVEDGVHNLCFIVSSDQAKHLNSDAERILREVLFRNRQAERSLANATVVDAWLAVPIDRYGRTSLAPAEGLLSIGDAGGFIDPFTGSGILLALESSRLAAQVVVSCGVSDRAALKNMYEAKYRAKFDRRLGVSSLVRKAAFVPWLSGAVINCLSWSRGLTEGLAKATRTAG
jgi:flavin-dependent dehydrogenase